MKSWTAAALGNLVAKEINRCNKVLNVDLPMTHNSSELENSLEESADPLAGFFGCSRISTHRN